MAEGIAKFIMGIEGVAFLVGLVIIIFLIFRRRRIKQTEDFENRTN